MSVMSTLIFLSTTFYACWFTTTTAHATNTIAVSDLYAHSDVFEPVPVAAVPEDYDCPMRQLALQFAMDIQPFLSTAQLQEIADALNGAQESVNKSCVTVPTATATTTSTGTATAPVWDKDERQRAQTQLPSIYVDFVRGDDDENDGLSVGSPVQHLDHAVQIARQMNDGRSHSEQGIAVDKRIVLREGTHYLRRPIQIMGHRDDNLLITNYDHEQVVLSGGTPITCDSWGTQQTGWKVLNGVDGIYGRPTAPGHNSTDNQVVYLGTYQTFQDCQTKAESVRESFGFGSFTWQTADAGQWKYVCYGTIGTKFQTHTASDANTGVWVNIYSCDLSSQSSHFGNEIMGLRINGKRAIRARYPNGNPEVFPCGFCSSLKAKSWVQPTCNPHPTTEYNPTTPSRDTASGHAFSKYQLGVGGCCDAFTPNAGYWCGNQTSGGGASTYKIPAGLVYDSKVLPNAPYANIHGAVIQTWRPGHWSSWMFEVDASKYNPSTGTIMFSKGGFQGARGNNNGDEFFIENVMEELDFPTEYYYDTAKKVLYYFNNGTGPPTDIKFETTNLKVLMNYTGTMASPAANHELRGLTFQDTQYTYMDPHGMPSGGDWGLERTGALYLDGVRNITITQNVLTRLDGNGISVNRYARAVTISRNEIVWQGDSAVSMWGDAENISFADGSTMGFDGTNGNQPRGVQFVQNFVHEIGISEKQSSMWFQAKSCGNVLDSNIFFNGPRAGINFNDGFGGGSKLKKNLVFNTCRESGDHGPFNSWDRQVYVTKVNDGKTASVIKAYDEITQNFMIANYNSQEAIDNDDGSGYYKTHANFFSYSGNGMKNDFGGHDNHHYANIYGYLGSHCFGIGGQLQGHQDAFYNNTCIINSNSQTTYGSFDCNAQNSGNQWPKMGGNTIYQFGDASKVGLCGKPEAEFQKTYPGADDGTVIKGAPNNAQIMAQAKALLFA